MRFMILLSLLPQKLEVQQDSASDQIVEQRRVGIKHIYMFVVNSTFGVNKTDLCFQHVQKRCTFPTSRIFNLIEKN